MMRCTKCGRLRSMRLIRFVSDGKVPGTVSTPRHKAVCAKCILGASEGVTETVQEGAPF